MENRIRELRKAAGLRQEDLARELLRLYREKSHTRVYG